MGPLKRYLPKGLFARSLLIFVFPVAVMQALIAWAFFEEHWETVTSRLSESVAGDVAMMTELFEQTGEDEIAFEPLAETAYRTMRLSVDFRPGETLPTSRRTSFFRTLDRTLRRALTADIDRPVWFDTTRYPAYVDIRVETETGVLRFIAVRERVFATTGHIFLLWLVGATALLSLVMVVFMRNQVKPIRRLAEAAEQFGRGQDAENFKPAGAREVRQAAHAFLEMRGRIKRHLEQRTEMLAGVSHDLRTPLTRLKLQLALLPKTDETEEARRDVCEMEIMLDEYLAFARGQAGEETQTTDLTALVRETVEDTRRTGAAVTLEAEDGIFADIRPGVIKRCMANLLTNAVTYGETAAVSVRKKGSRVEIIFDDDGPGIPAELHEEAFKPFSRLDDSRNLNTEGVGLGLAIARDAARGHGGEIRLSESPMGGLRATLTLPV
ncbi:ATP-binding protein [Hyphobacterium marinum]|uniref:histidine kinase n=1 Tax=Hyphobacterium marinum TaxID=3116574 RepID=A0ABU7M0W0_9PROT|nr:ATP-binding protein [Hyphobacterium sp. Y6023]MEE2567426.1 ATP-binding protein [Hyphobacterium sp. Y6023]